jgi:hypothetical protein
MYKDIECAHAAMLLASISDLKDSYLSRRLVSRQIQLDDLKETRGYWKLKEEALDRTVWRTGFGRGYVLVTRQTME